MSGLRRRLSCAVTEMRIVGPGTVAVRWWHRFTESGWHYLPAVTALTGTGLAMAAVASGTSLSRGDMLWLLAEMAFWIAGAGVLIGLVNGWRHEAERWRALATDRMSVMVSQHGGDTAYVWPLPPPVSPETLRLLDDMDGEGDG